MIEPRDTTQNSVFDEGKLTIRVLRYTGSRGYDMIENIQFPSFLINSPEVKNECNSVNIWILETLEGSIRNTMTSRAQSAEN